VHVLETVVRMGGTIANRLFGEMEREVVVGDFLVHMQALRADTEARGTRMAVVVMGNPLHVEEPLNDVLWTLRLPGPGELEGRLGARAHPR